MLTRWNEAIALIDEQLTQQVDVVELARLTLTSEYHFRRVFSVLAGMPVSEYIRRRRMSVAAADVLGGLPLEEVALRYAYGSVDGFRRAFTAVHGLTPEQARQPGATLRSQPRLRFHPIEGSTLMRHRVTALDPFRLVGAGTRIPLVYRGPNPAMIAFHRALPPSLADRLAGLGDMPEPGGPFSASSDFTEDRADGSEFHYLYGVATRRSAADLPGDLDVVEVPGHTWVVFEIEAESGFHAALQQAWADAFGEWFPSNPYRVVPAPEILAVTETSDDGEAGRGALWIAVERG
ncbi:AraC family transcriptional regulator [Arthrobacter ruber]|uniref:AraC family transcriptional regulator n=1 Tax=Arthrobacter ruber TaxID=1258893 RepID=UPI000CF4B6E1|nr:helix-turn-helix domain-containing protein [Arthrobacter ruber]